MARLGRSQPVRAVIVRSRRYPTVWIQDFDGALDFTGAIEQAAFYARALAAALTFTGAVKNKSNRILTAALSFTGAIEKHTTRALAAALPFTGAFRTITNKILTAALTPAGALAKSLTFSKALAATLTFSTDFDTLIGKVFTASISFAGSLKRRASRAIAAVLDFVGNLFILDFPSVSVVDNFNRADAADLGVEWIGPIDTGQETLMIVSNQAGHTDADQVGVYSSYREVMVDPDQEAFVTVTEISGIDGTKIRIFGRIEP